MLSFVKRKTHGPELERRRLFVEGYAFPTALRERLGARYDPALSGAQLSLLLEGLRSWFVACLYAEGKVLGMPSTAVDAAWHEFILFTREYHEFCEAAFGRYLHHVPESTMRVSQGEATARTLAVLDRHPEAAALTPAGIPLLFAVDSELGLADEATWTKDDVEGLRDGSRAVAGGSCGGDASSDGGGGASCGASCGAG